ncbi:hypothetical protein C4573_06210 [Candidatus Woesearchaeota archaeon]|nr:MAG: hypothetical protein C4573_06210 [Candidatus Woesearchaeota archaeon]
MGLESILRKTVPWIAALGVAASAFSTQTPERKIKPDEAFRYSLNVYPEDTQEQRMEKMRFVAKYELAQWRLRDLNQEKRLEELKNLDANYNPKEVNDFFNEVLQDLDPDPITPQNEFYDLLDGRIAYASQKSRECFHFYIPDQVVNAKTGNVNSLLWIEDMLDDYGDLIISAGIPAQEHSVIPIESARSDDNSRRVSPYDFNSGAEKIEVLWPDMRKEPVIFTKDCWQFCAWKAPMDNIDVVKILAGLRRTINKEDMEPLLEPTDIFCNVVAEPNADRTEYRAKMHFRMNQTAIKYPFSVRYAINIPITDTIIAADSLRDSLYIPDSAIIKVLKTEYVTVPDSIKALLAKDETVYYPLASPYFYTLGDESKKFRIGIEFTSLNPKLENQRKWKKVEHFNINVDGIIPTEEGIIVRKNDKLPDPAHEVEKKDDSLYIKFPTHFVSADTMVPYPMSNIFGIYECNAEVTFNPVEKEKRASTDVLELVVLPWDDIEGKALDSITAIAKATGKVPETYSARIPSNQEETAFKDTTLEVPKQVKKFIMEFVKEEKKKPEKKQEVYVISVPFNVNNPNVSGTLPVPLYTIPKGEYLITVKIDPKIQRMYSEISIPYQQVKLDKVIIK